MPKDHQRAIFEAMQVPGFYPHAVDAVEEIETHISRVFLAGDYVYKVKKAVDFGFLDFSSLEKRRYFCDQEVMLNRRLAHDVYRGVAAIRLGEKGYTLDGNGDRIVEYAVQMRRLPSSRTMEHLLQEDALDAGDLKDLGRLLAHFYQNARTGAHIDKIGSWETVRRNCHENFDQLKPFVDRWIDARTYAIVRASTYAFLNRRRALFAKRLQEGRVRDGHGDLRSDHIYFTDAGIRIIDCIEFNERLRFGDSSSDLGFLAMDLDFQGFGEAAATVLEAYIQHSGDDEVPLLINFYKCYRALVRAKVHCLTLKQAGADPEDAPDLHRAIDRHVALAFDYAVDFIRPTLWIVCGLIAAGKSTLAQALAEKLNVRLLRSDQIRKQLFTDDPEQSRTAAFGADIYSPHATALTYAHMLEQAQQEIEKGASVILDATFSQRKWRMEARRLAADTDANIVFIQCTAAEAVLKRRLRDRDSQPSRSDARLQHYAAFKADYEPLDDIPSDHLISIDTALPLQEGLRRIMASDFLLMSRHRGR